LQSRTGVSRSTSDGRFRGARDVVGRQVGARRADRRSARDGVRAGWRRKSPRRGRVGAVRSGARVRRADVGAFFETVALFTIATTISVWGADIGLVRTIPRLVVLRRADSVRPLIQIAVASVFAIAAVLAVAMAALATPLSELITSGVAQTTVEPLIRAVAPFVPVAAVFAVVLAATRGLGRMGPTNVIDRSGRAAVQPIFALGVAILGLGTVALVVAWALPYGIGCLFAALWLARLLRETPADARTGDALVGRALFAEFWRFAAPRGLAGAFAVAVVWLDTLLIGALRSTQEAGVYAAATRFLLFGGLAAQAVIQAIGPILSELITRRERHAAAAVYRTGTAWSMALGWPIYLLLAIFAPTLLSVLGPGYVGAADALRILAVAMLFGSGVGPVDIALLMAGKSSWNLLNTAAAVSVNVVLNLLLIPRLGITGAAIAWAASIVVNNLVPLIQVRGLVGLHPIGVATVSVGLTAIVVFGVIPVALRAVLPSDAIALAVAAVVGVLLYLPALWRLRRTLALDRLAGSVNVGGLRRRSVHSA
jgi:O-antigen/teichoic acid export membrane protein